MKKLYLTIIVTILFMACTFSTKEHVTGNYYLVSTVENSHAISLSYYLEKEDAFVGVSPYGIKSADFDDNYIFLWRNTSNRRAVANEFNKEFYIVPICNNCQDYSKLDIIFGPYNKREFQTKLSELNVDKKIKW